MPGPVVLSTRALEGLRAYKYKPGGYTWLDHAHQPFWNWLTEQLPMWLAPNLITLTGLIWLFAAYAGMWYYAPEFLGPAPRWAYLLNGIAIIVYTNLDCIDGKQARRTKSSSPLGQLFDHGCDALALHVMLALVQSALSHSSGLLSSITIFAVNLPWLSSHWEEYHTGVLMYGDGYFGVLEANYILALISLTSGVFGPGVWATPMARLIPHWPHWAGPNTEVRHCFCVVAALAAVGQLSGQFKRVFSQGWEVLPEAERGNKELGTWARVKHLLYSGVACLLGCVWLADGGLKPGEARLASLAFGLVYALVATQLIMDHMCKEPFHPPLLAGAVALAAAANSVVELVDTRLVAAASVALLLGYYLWYVTTIVNQVCAYLGIKCYTIEPKPHRP